MFKDAMRQGDVVRNVVIQAINRTAKTLTRGCVVQLDFAVANTTAGSATEAPSRTVAPTGKIGVMGTAILPATAGLNACIFGIVMNTTDILDDDTTPLQLCIFGLCEAAVVDNDVGAGDAVAGDPLTVLNGLAYLQLQTASTRGLGACLESGAAATDTDASNIGNTLDSAGAASLTGNVSHRRWVFFNGIPGGSNV